MGEAPLGAPQLAAVGPLTLTWPLVVTWLLMAALALVAAVSTRRLAVVGGRWQVALEVIVEALEDQLQETMQTAPRPFLPLLGSLFLFILFANLAGLLPGVTAPTAYLETDAALALIVLLAIQVYGFRRRGTRAYLTSFIRPNPLMLPLNLLGEITRTFSLMVRLFGNIMSGHLIIAIVLSLAGLFLPIPLMALEIVLGAIQAYIFTVLSAVFIGAAVGANGEG